MSARCLLCLRLGEDLRSDDRLVDLLGRPDPIGAVVPAELRLVPGRDVVDVDQLLVAALAVPHLAARVAGVPEDGVDGSLPPRAARVGSMTVARWVVCAGGGDPVC